MKILSLFDGISCGMVALERADIPVESYDAFEIDKYAVKISEKNYPQIVHHGDVFGGSYSDFKGYDLLIGGSPCTYWSIAKTGREVTPDGMGGKLFMEYVRALRESGCKYFLYENNNSIHQNIKDFISEQLGVKPIMINSALVSAQQRKRCYWTNIPNVSQPADKGILLKDILESGLPWQDKSYCMTASYDGAVLWNTLQRSQRSMIAEPVGVAQRGRYIQSGKRSEKCAGGTEQFIEARKDGKSNCLTTVQKDSMIAEPIRIGKIGNGGQGQRIYSVRGKSVTLSANGVIVPPVKVGDTVFFKNAPYTVIDIRFDGEMHFCARLDCDEENDCSKCPFSWRSALSDTVGCIGEEYKDFSPSDIGKRIFLTSEEAEKALAERSDKE